MAIKFSQFVVETNKANVNYIVGWDGAENVQITPADLLSGYPTFTGSTGQVAFFDSASSIGGDNDLFFDNTNKRLGIGTINPVEKLQINSGDVLINNSTISSLKSGGSLHIDLNTFGSYSGRNFRISDNGTSLVNVTQAGNVGIGTTSPSAKLEVDGTLIATGISQLGSGGANVYLTSSSAGNVGIGTSSPDSLLHVAADVSGANTGTITIEGRPTGFLGDDIATIDFHNNGSKRADIRMERGNTGTDSQLVFSTSDAGTLNDALIINEAGNVGIGTSSPDSKLTVDTNIDSNSAPLLIQNTGLNDSGQLQLGIPKSNNAYATGSTLGDVVMRNTEASSKLILGGTDSVVIGVGGIDFDPRMTIKGTGNVGIGTTSPSEKLDVNGNILISDTGNDKYFGSNVNLILNADADGNSGDSARNIIFKNRNSEKMRIDYIGNVGIGTTTPDSTLEVQNTPAQGSQTMMLHLDNNPVSNEGSGYLQISSGTNTQAAMQIEQVSSGGSGIFGNNYLDTSIINRGLSASAYGNINFATGSSTSATSIVMTIGGGSQKGNVGIGTTSPASKLEVDGGDIEVDDSASGLILRSPDGTRYRVTVANGGTLSVAAV